MQLYEVWFWLDDLIIQITLPLERILKITKKIKILAKIVNKI